MKKVFYWISSTLQVLLLIAAYGIQFFSMKKMGMMRYVVYINHKWEAQYPIAALQYIAIAVLVLLVVITYVAFIKTKKDARALGKMSLPMMIMQAAITLAYVFFTLSYSAESFRSYYFICLILAVIALIQDIKVLIYLKKNV
jgi:hypothetical protein